MTPGCQGYQVWNWKRKSKKCSFFAAHLFSSFGHMMFVSGSLRHCDVFSSQWQVGSKRWLLHLHSYFTNVNINRNNVWGAGGGVIRHILKTIFDLTLNVFVWGVQTKLKQRISLMCEPKVKPTSEHRWPIYALALFLSHSLAHTNTRR